MTCLGPGDHIGDNRMVTHATGRDSRGYHEEPKPHTVMIRGSHLTERRSQFVYDAARLAAIAANAPIIPIPWEEREEPFKAQFRRVIERQCGEQRSHSPEELHGSWMQAYYAMGWSFGSEYDRERKCHPDLVPYAKLGQLERDKDAVFVALCEIARQWIYDDIRDTPGYGRMEVSG